MSNITQQLSKLDVSRIKMGNGKTVEQNLKTEAKRLLNCIQNYIDDYYESYSPKYYERTNKFRNSMYAEDFIQIDIVRNTMYLHIKFVPDLAIHPSVVNDYQDGYVPLLINDGWSWEGWIGDEDHFHKYSGFHFIEKGIASFNKQNKLGIKIEVDKKI